MTEGHTRESHSGESPADGAPQGVGAVPKGRARISPFPSSAAQELECSRDPAGTDPRRESRSGKLGWLVIGAVIGTLIAIALSWPVERLLNSTFPQSAPHLTWAVRANPAPEGEAAKLRLLTATPDEPLLLMIYAENDGSTTLENVTFLVEASQPILAHAIPGALHVTDHGGKPIIDRLQRFSHEKFGKFTFHDFPAGIGLYITFFAPKETDFSVLCIVHDQLIPLSPWPNGVFVEKFQLPITFQEPKR